MTGGMKGRRPLVWKGRPSEPEQRLVRKGRRPLAWLGTLLVVAACGMAGAAEQGENAAAGGSAAMRDSPDRDGPAAGDSVLPMPAMIERFQARHASVSAFPQDAAGSREELIERFARAVEDSSSVGLRRLTLTAAEFAYLYFPSSVFSRPPYAQPPEITWLLTDQNGLKGETRLLRHYGGRPLQIIAHACEAEPRREGRNTIWNECRLSVRAQDGSHVEDVRLFGSIIQRDGRFKFGSLANRL